MAHILKNTNATSSAPNAALNTCVYMCDNKLKIAPEDHLHIWLDESVDVPGLTWFHS